MTLIAVRTLAASIGLALFATSSWADDVSDRRVALLALALSKSQYRDKLVEIRCPAYMATTQGVMCAVVNSKLETVGSMFVDHDRLPAAERTQLVERCASPATVKPNCVANMTVSVNDWDVVYALTLEWTAPQ